MDSKTKQKLIDFVLATTLYHVARDGVVEDWEKQAYQKLVKAMKASPERLKKIKSAVAKQVKAKPQQSALNYTRLFQAYHKKFQTLLDEKESKHFLKKLAKVLEIEDRYEQEIYRELFDQDVPVKAEQIQSEKIEPTKQQSSYQESSNSPEVPSKPQPASPDAMLAEYPQMPASSPATIKVKIAQEKPKRKTVLEQLEFLVPDQSTKYFKEITQARELGDHMLAKEDLENYSIPLNYEVRYTLLYRIHLELYQNIEAAEYLEKAQSSGLSESIYKEEKVYLDYLGVDPAILLEHYWSYLKWDENDEQIGKEEACLSLVDGLMERHQYHKALELLLTVTRENSSETLQKKLEYLQSHLHEDIYFRYYGPTIMGLQLLVSLLVLLICLFNINYIGPAFMGLLQSLVAGVPDQRLLLDHLQKLLPFSFLVIALFPVCYVNSIMLYAWRKNKSLSYCQIHPRFIKLVDFGQIYHLALHDRNKPIFIYQDDNDYTYISLVRHLPFIPNFTYIYGFDQLRKFQCLLPLYGVADGYLFRKKFLTSKSQLVLPINMLGVRLGQASTVISKVARSYFVIIPIILGAGLFFYANWSFAADASFEAYLSLFLAFLFVVGGLVVIPLLSTKILTTRILQFPFIVNIIKPGLMALMAAYLARHYYSFSWSGIIPAACLLYAFYIVFVRSKYAPEKKQIVALISSARKLPNSDEDLFEVSQGLMALYLGKESGSRNRVHLFFNKEFIAVTRKIMGMTLYYDVISKTSQFKILVEDRGGKCLLRISQYNFTVHESAEKICEKLDRSDLAYSLTKIEERNRSKIPLGQLAATFAVYMMWQVHSILVVPDFNVAELKPDFQALEVASQYLVTENKIIRHSDQFVPYSRLIDYEKKWITFHQESAMTWGEYENSIAKSLNRTQSLQLKVPGFIKKDAYRDDLFSFLSWHSFRRWRSVDAARYSQELVDFCSVFGGGLLKSEDRAVCAYRFTFDDALKYINQKKQISQLFDDESLVPLCRVDGKILQYRKANLNRNETVVFAAVRQDGLNLQYSSLDLRKDPDIVAAAIKQNVEAQQFMHESMKANAKVMRALLEQDGNFYEILHTSLSANPELLKIALKSNQRAYLSMSSELYKNKEVMSEVLKIDGMMFQHLQGPLNADKELIQIALDQNGDALQFLSTQNRSDPQIVLQALKTSPKAHQYMSPVLLNNRKVVLEVLGYDGTLLKKLSEDLRNDRELVKKALEQSYLASSHMPSHFFNDEELVLIILSQHGLSLSLVPPSLLSKEKVILTALRQNGLALEFVPEDKRAQTAITLEAVKQDGRALKFAPESLRSDPQIYTVAVRQNVQALQFAKINLEELKNKAMDGELQSMTYYAFLAHHGLGLPPDVKQAASMYKAAAERGNVESQLALAYMYLYGEGIRKDDDLAWKWFQEASDGGSLQASTMLAWLTEHGISVFPDLGRAKERYIELSRTFAPANFLLAKLLLEHENLRTDKTLLRNSLRDAADASLPLAMLELAKQSLHGIYLPKDLSLAAEYAQKAAERDVPEAQLYYALVLEYGLGTDKDNEKAKKLYRALTLKDYSGSKCYLYSEAIQPSPDQFKSLNQWTQSHLWKGSPRNKCLEYDAKLSSDMRSKTSTSAKIVKELAQSQSDHPHIRYLQSKMYSEGIGVLQDLKKARELLNQASELGHLSARYELGLLMEQEQKGALLSQDLLDLFQSCVDDNYLPAMNHLGEIYESGVGVKRNYQLAARYYKMAADQYYPPAMSNLASMLEWGKGTTQNETEAIRLNWLASSKGDEKGALGLKTMVNSGIDVYDQAKRPIETIQADKKPWTHRINPRRLGENQ